MTRKVETVRYTTTDKNEKADFWLKFALNGMVVSLFCTLITLIYGRINVDNPSKVITILMFVSFAFSGIFSSLLLFFALKYSDDPDYSKYTVVEKDYLKDLERRVNKK